MPLMRISENQYYEALDGLPPLAYERPEEDCEQFCTIEFLTANFTVQYFHSPEGWFCRNVDYRDRSTWITRAEVRSAS